MPRVCRRSHRHALVAPLLLLLGACVPIAETQPASRAAVMPVPEASSLPPMKRFAAPRPSAPVVSNADLARDFLDLAFTLESGRSLPVFTRFEGPITLRVSGAVPASLGPDLAGLLARLQREAGIAITQTEGPSANITLQAVSREEIGATLPGAACFVVPNVASLAEYRSRRRSATVSWSRLRARRQLAIFLPGDASPQEVRDCLHEELAQALGPLNDLYRLPDSVFNDDNVHTVLTGHDMLVLRAYYDPALQTGMSRAAVAARLPEILARINPAGEGRAPRHLPPTPRSWIEAIQTALGPGAHIDNRRRAAARALALAEGAGWRDHRRAFSHYAMGRILQGSDPGSARDHFTAAERYFGSGPETALHRAYVGSQLAAHAISEGRPAAALPLLAPHLEVAARHENAALLATLMMLRAEALALTGQHEAARRQRLDSLGWARYGFGSDWAVRAKLREVGLLNPARRRHGAP
jgi:hypothetical protein